jgi:hypothetical protein
MDNLMQNMIEKEAARLNTANMNLVKSLEQTFELEGLVFMDMVQENELPQDNMTYLSLRMVTSIIVSLLKRNFSQKR